MKAIVRSFLGWMGREETVCVGCGTLPGKRKDVVVGPAVALCRHCLDDAFAVLKSNQDIVRVRGSKSYSIRCSFCGNNGVDRGGLASWPKGTICRECLLLCDEILLERGARTDHALAT